MTLKSGTWLNHYEVLDHLGTGGMGEVYRARDNKLQREVALKVLPKAFAQDPERVARFRREAQVLAQLNHTNIAAIYSVEQSEETHFLVMELAQGETLRDRIKRGSIPVEEALDIAKQIAAGLEAAHEKPIVHRDLKPANVKVTPDGVVKILDFGLARAFAGDSGSGDPADSPTLSAMTAPGTILGTAAYMSPEQARGKKVDKRTDIWALGCVLYEMLTGKHAFEGEDVPEILASVMKGEPDWSALPETTPPNVRFMLRRCLEKDAKRRLRDAADLQIQMEETQAASATTVPAAAPAIPARTGWRQMLLPVAASAVVVAVIASLAAWNLKPVPPQPVTRLALTLPATEQLGARGFGLNSPSVALSPDGTHLAYVAVRGGDRQLFLRSMDQLEGRPIPGTEDAWDPFFSPDGQWVGFFAGGQLKKVSISGGAPLALSDAPQDMGGSWGPDDTIVFAPTPTSGLMQVSAAGGTPQELTTRREGELAHRWPEFLPGGQAVLFAVGTGTTWAAQQIVVESMETGERRTLIAGASYARYVPTGHLLYIQSATPGTLLSVPFDLARLEVTGAPVPVVEGVMMSPTFFTPQFSLSHLGALVYVSGSFQAAQNMLVWVDRQGAVESLGAPSNQYRDPRLSPDGQRLAVRVTGDSSDIWVYDISRTTLTRLTFEGSNEHPVWTPDGSRVAFRSSREGQETRNLFWKLADGSGSAERLSESSEQWQSPTSWSPDGQLLAFYERLVADASGLSTNFNIWVLPLEGEHKPQPFLQTPFSERAGVFSPDGRWLAYMSNESGRYEIYVQPFPGPGGKRQISTEGGVEPVWSRNGQELFYRNGDRMMAVEITTEPVFSAGIPAMLFEGSFETTNNFRPNYDVTPDGQRFVMIQQREQDSAATQINVVLNWFEELQQRVPTAE